MNRKKKINETLKKRLKRKVDRQKSTNKPRYISKAEREKLALAAESSAAESSAATEETQVPAAQDESADPSAS